MPRRPQYVPKLVHMPTQLPGMNAPVPTRKRACTAGAQQASMVNESETRAHFVPMSETTRNCSTLPGHVACNLTPSRPHTLSLTTPSQIAFAPAMPPWVALQLPERCCREECFNNSITANAGVQSKRLLRRKQQQISFKSASCLTNQPMDTCKDAWPRTHAYIENISGRPSYPTS